MCFIHYLNFHLVSERVHLLGFNYLSAIIDPVAVDAAMEKAMLNCGLNVCDNDSMSVFEGCPINELLELLKTKKHARMFVHMLKYFENKNHILHNSLSESNSLIKKYKRKNGILCERVDNLKKKIKLKINLCLKVKNVCLVLVYLCTPH